MNIEFQNYILEPELGKFNIYKKVIRKKTGGAGKQATEETENYEGKDRLGYGFRFEQALKEIALDMLAEKEGTVSIEQWIKEYKEVSELLLNSLKV